MATFVVCTRCSKVCETAGLDQLPKRWKTSDKSLICPSCAGAEEEAEAEAEAATGDVLDEEVLYPPASAGTLDEIFDEGTCTVYRGPCQGR